MLTDGRKIRHLYRTMLEAGATIKCEAIIPRHYHVLGRLLKIDEICPLAFSNQIFKISMHILSLVKIYWYLLKLSSGNENKDVWQWDIDETCPLSIPYQISTVSMHISSLVNIHWDLLVIVPKLKYGCFVTDNSVKNWWKLPINNP